MFCGTLNLTQSFVWITMQDYKSLHAAGMTWVTLVNTHTHTQTDIHTDRQLLDRLLAPLAPSYLYITGRNMSEQGCVTYNGPNHNHWT